MSKVVTNVPRLFGALAGSFDLTNDEFSERFLPWVRLAFVFLQRDFVQVEALVRDMARQGGEQRLNETDNAWTSCAEAFGAITEFVEAAKIRLSAVRACQEFNKATGQN
jgi:hypothetical protein